MAPLKVKINEHKEWINVVVTDLNRMDMFFGHDWLVKQKERYTLQDVQDHVEQVTKRLCSRQEEHK